MGGGPVSAVQVLLTVAALLAGGVQEGKVSLSKQMQEVVTALQTGDIQAANTLIKRVVAARPIKAPSETATTEITPDQLLKMTRGCEIRQVSAVDLGIEDVSESKQIVWACPASADRPAITSQTILIRRGSKIEVHAFALPADLPSISTPAVPSSERGND